MAVLGGSTVFLGDPPISELLERELNKNGYPGARVYNFGVVASVSSMDLARLVFEVADLEPQLVIMYGGGNDITSPFFFDPRPGYPMDFLVYENNPLLTGDLSAYPTLTLLSYGSNVMRLLFPDFFRSRFVPMAKLRKEANWNSEEWSDEIARIYVNNVIKGAEIAKSFGSEFIAFFQPLIYFKRFLSPDEDRFIEAAERKWAARGLTGFREHAIRTSREIIDGFDSARATRSVHCVDLSDLYAEVQESVFTDFIHTTQARKDIVARAMFREILDRLDLGRSPDG